MENCLRGLDEQQRRPDQVIVVVRPEDLETRELLSRWSDRLPITEVTIEVPGQIAAMNAGTKNATGDLISTTDDDAVPRPDWLAKIEQTFQADDRLGALGGRDILRSGGDIPTQLTEEVGKVNFFGRVVGNHHAGAGKLRDVDHLKGVNMSWRVSAAGVAPFVSDLRGTGAQVFNELSFCFKLNRKGWAIQYDPSIVVDHYVAARFDEDNRAQRNLLARENAAFNFYLAFLQYRKPGWKRNAALLWARLVGIRDMPGLAREGVSILKNDVGGKAVAKVARKAWHDAQEHSAHARGTRP